MKDHPATDARQKLTDEQIAEIKASHYRTALLAQRFGVSAARISQIRNRSDRQA